MKEDTKYLKTYLRQNFKRLVRIGFRIGRYFILYTYVGSVAELYYWRPV